MPCIKYSQRLLNPFRGSISIIEYKGAEAVSLDGVHWDINVRSRKQVKNLQRAHQRQIFEIHYGHWSAQSGLKRGPTYSSGDFRQMQEQGARVYEYLLAHYQDIPFPFLDNYELWLLDSDYKPLALINSSLRESNTDNPPLLDWRAGQLCCKEFESGAYLTGYINQKCSLPPRAQWFKRTLNGRGIGMHGHHIPQELTGRELRQHAFGELMLNRRGHDKQHSKLIDEFIQWQSPWLLLLDSLSKNQRMMLEKASYKRALLVEKLHRLYPEIIDPRFINAARVEASLRNSNAQNIQSANDHLHTEYIERLPSTRD